MNWFETPNGVVLVPGASLAAPQKVQGTRVVMVPPPGFVAAEQFPGFQQNETTASIMVTELPGPVAALRAEMNADGLRRRGMTLIDSEDIVMGGRPALLLHVTQTARDEEFEKWMVVTGDGAQSVLVVASCPRGLPPALGESLETAIRSVQWDPDQRLDLFDGLPFRVREAGAFKVANRISNMILLADPGVSTGSPEDPLIIVGTSLGDVRIEDVTAFAKQRLAETSQIKDLSDVYGREVTVNGLAAYELAAVGVDLKSGISMRIYQMVIADGARYFLVQGFVGESRANEFLPQFREVAESLTRVP